MRARRPPRRPSRARVGQHVGAARRRSPCPSVPYRSVDGDAPERRSRRPPDLPGRGATTSARRATVGPPRRRLRRRCDARRRCGRYRPGRVTARLVAVRLAVGSAPRWRQQLVTALAGCAVARPVRRAARLTLGPRSAWRRTSTARARRGTGPSPRLGRRRRSCRRRGRAVEVELGVQGSISITRIEATLPLARLAEELGYRSWSAQDHVVLPTASGATHRPAHADRRRAGAPRHVAAVTQPDDARHRRDHPSAAQPARAGQAGREPRRAQQRPVRPRRRRRWLAAEMAAVGRTDGRTRRAHGRVPRRDDRPVDRPGAGVPRALRRLLRRRRAPAAHRCPGGRRRAESRRVPPGGEPWPRLLRQRDTRGDRRRPRRAAPRRREVDRPDRGWASSRSPRCRSSPSTRPPRSATPSSASTGWSCARGRGRCSTTPTSSPASSSATPPRATRG